MNSIERSLLELIRIAETPLYSAYRWLHTDVGRELSLMSFRRMIGKLMADDVLQLWHTDAVTGVRNRLISVPANLEALYASSSDLDDAFDPFGLSLTVGGATGDNLTSSWTIDFDEAASRFYFRAPLAQECNTFSEAQELFPELSFVVKERITRDDYVEITGSVERKRG